MSFRIISKNRGDIHKARCTIGINNTGGKFATGSPVSYDLTLLCPLKSRLQNIYHDWQPYAWVDLNHMQESTLSSSQWLWIWPQKESAFPSVNYFSENSLHEFYCCTTYVGGGGWVGEGGIQSFSPSFVPHKLSKRKKTHGKQQALPKFAFISFLWRITN